MRPATSAPSTPPTRWLSEVSARPFNAASGPTISKVYACLMVIVKAQTHPMLIARRMMGQTNPVS